VKCTFGKESHTLRAADVASSHSSQHLVPERHANSWDVTQERAILVGGRVGNVACEDQVRLCHLSGVQAEARDISASAGRTIRGRSFTLEASLAYGSPSGSCKGASWEEIVRLMAENGVTLYTETYPKGGSVT
jgi:hypothetical protein